MRNRILFTFVLLFVFFNTNAQQDSINILWKDINALKSNNKALLNSNKELFQQISLLNQSIDSISKIVQSNTLNIQQTADSLGIKISTTESLSNQKYDELGNSLSKSTLYGIIALLFAIYLVKPSPFCILDEVDAPLDDSNIDRFLNLIKSFSLNTQFIIVTHNKRTMEAANTLYGITMEEKGVSKLVSVQLAQNGEIFSGD